MQLNIRSRKEFNQVSRTSHGGRWSLFECVKNEHLMFMVCDANSVPVQILDAYDHYDHQNWSKL